ncbi:DDI1 [Auxenochlorella protothecoides x Auxenochlorella symbiontica]
MQLTVVAEIDGRVLLVDLDGSDELSTLTAIVEAETGIPAAAQRLTLGSRTLQPDQTLGAQGLAEGDLLMLSLAPTGRAPAPSQNPSSLRAFLRPDGSAEDPGALLRMLASNPHALSQLPPELARAVRDSDIPAFQDEMRRLTAERVRADEEEARFARMAAEDPFNPEVQARLEEAIRQKNVAENFEAAMEYNPEAFGNVTMLYVLMQVNGVALKTFVDSGAQVTIMSQSCAERCGLLRLMDTRFQGTAVGVGSAKILGRIHMAPLLAGGHHLPISIAILDNLGQDFIFGLDNLRRHQCCVDLKAGVLRFGSTEAQLPFLPEHEIPQGEPERNPMGGLSASNNAERSHTTAASAPQATPSPAVGTQASAPPAAAAQTQPVQTGGQAGWEGKVLKLVELGFSREQSLAALRSAQGNEDVAASILFTS